MKRRLSLFLVCILILNMAAFVCATCEDISAEAGFVIEFNGEVSEGLSVVINGEHYVPIRYVFEKMGASIYFKSRDKNILALTRDGDMIYHIAGDNRLIVNGVEKVFDKTSVSQNNITYMPLDMLQASLCPDGILCENGHLNIQKAVYDSDYHKAVRDVMDMRWHPDFNPEKFQRYITYHRKVPAYGIHDVVYRVNVGLDYPFYENVTTTEYPYGLLVLVNKYNRLPEDFSQYNLVAMDRAYTSGGQQLLAGVAYEKYVEMADAAKKEGLSMRVVSAYRTEAYQGNLYNNKVRTTGKVNADNYSARAGHSEHQTGLAVDINSTKFVFEYSPEYKWLLNHAHEYGFILRYPKGKEWLTGYSFEAWHYRYVGVEAAKIIHDEDLVYEEYYARYIDKSEFK